MKNPIRKMSRDLTTNPSECIILDPEGDKHSMMP